MSRDGGERSWVFDRPLWRDPLFVLGTVLGVVTIVSTVASWSDYGAGAMIFTIGVAVPFWVLMVGITLGSIREYLRANARRRS